MFTFLLILCLVSVTFLITDFRRHLEIEDIKTANAVQMNLLSMRAFEAGLKVGARDEQRKTHSVLISTPN